MLLFEPPLKSPLPFLAAISAAISSCMALGSTAVGFSNAAEQSQHIVPDMSVHAQELIWESVLSAAIDGDLMSITRLLGIVLLHPI